MRMLAAAIFLCATFLLPAAADPAPGKAGQIESALAASFSAKDPGGTVIVTHNGEVVFRKAYGMADLERQVPMTPERPLRIGSITKQFTAVAILMLAQEGRLSVDDDIARWFPEIAPATRPTTLRHLLTHRSGIHNFTSTPEYGLGKSKPALAAQVIALFKDRPRTFQPGDGFQYSNSNYFLLGLVVEKVSGIALGDFLAQRIFIPLGMSSTAMEGHERNGVLRAEGYEYQLSQGFRKASEINMDWPRGAGGMISSVDDMARWNDAIARGELLDEAHWKLAFTPPNGELGYGFGWSMSRMYGLPMRWHNGGIDGFSSSAAWIPGDNVYIAVLANSAGAGTSPDTILQRIMAIYPGPAARATR